MKTMMHILRRTLPLLLLSLLMQQTAKAQLHADFSTSPAGGCTPLFVSFHDQSTGNPTYWKWDLGNGTISYLQNPSATYFNSGKYTVKLVVKNANQSDSIVKQSIVTVNALPKPQFKVSDTTGCYPLSIQFTDQSLAQEGGIVKWEWDLGDGTISALQNPAHVYTSPGSYNVTLRVTNTAGCTGTLQRSQYIKIPNGVKAGFTFVNTNLCKPPSIVNFTNSSTGTGVLNYQWTFGDGNTSTLPNPSNNYTTAGLYTARLVVTNDKGCTDTMTMPKAVVVGMARASFSVPDSICEKSLYKFLNTSQPLTGSFDWNFGDLTLSSDTSPLKKYLAPGSYPVRLITNFGSCKDTAQKVIKVIALPAVSFTASKTVSCQAPFTVTFTSNTPGGTSFKWLFGDGSSSTQQNPTHTYQQAGDYSDTLVVANSTGCTDTLIKRNYITIRPVIIRLLSTASGCLPLDYSPSYSVNSVVPVTGYSWDFGDGGTSTQQYPSHTYTVQGIYTVKLTYTTAEGCTNTFVYPNAVYAGQKPHAAFAALPPDACASTPIGFTDQSTGTVTNYKWLFGDGTSDTLHNNPFHLYNDTGYFSVRLIASNYGCADTVDMYNVVHIQAPISRFGVTTDCATPYKYIFNNYSIGATSLTWDFADGTTSTDISPVHIFPDTGKYLVKLTVTDGHCTHVSAFPAYIVNEKADFTASSTSVCRGDSISLQPTGFNARNVRSYEWWYQSGSDTSSKIKVAYPQSGAYTVRLIINNVNGCADTMTKAQYLHVNGPVAGFAPAGNSACINKGGKIKFDDFTTTDGSHAIKNWQWSFGDNTQTSVSAPPFEHAYTAGGTYTVRLKVTDAAGCSDSISRPNQISIGDPKADFYSPDTASCTNKAIQFVNNSTGVGLQYFWRMGDGVNVNGVRSPAHSYPAVGKYDVELRIQDIYGCRDSLLTAEYINIDQPKAKYEMSDSVGTCPPLIVQFTNQSTYYKEADWDFGDGTGAHIANPVHYYSYPGTYYARLVVTSPGGCTDTYIRKIVVDGPTGTFSYDKTISCNPGTVAFTAVTANTTSLVWDFNDGSTQKTTVNQVSHTFTSMGIYVPRIILEDAQHCKVPIIGRDTISIYGIESMFDTDKRLVCDAGVVTFTDASVTNDLITGYEWHFGDGGVSHDQAPSHPYSVSGEYPIQLTVTTLNGCTSTSSQSTNIKVAASPRVLIRGDSSACAPATLKLTGNVTVPDTSALSWHWNFGNGTLLSGQTPQPVQYTQAGTYPVTLDVTNSSGCTTTVGEQAFIHPVPLVDAGSNAVMCEKKTTLLKATGADTYTWSPAASVSCVSCSGTLASPDSNTMYHLHGETVYGCKADDSVLVRVKHPFVMRVGAGDTLCKGELFKLSAGNAELYDWSPSAGIEYHAASPSVRPDQTTNYRVIGYDSAGCFYDTGFVKVVVYNFPTVDAGPDQTISVGSSTQLKLAVSEDVNYIQWQPATGLSCANCTSPVANPKQTTSYRITVMNQGGCANKEELTLFVVCNGGNVFIPNTFSPNGDGSNDVFYPRGTGLYTIRSMRLFNRWGEPVYEATNFLANDPSKGWTGLYKNAPAPNDVYVYFVEVVCENNAILTYSGNVALIR